MTDDDLEALTDPRKAFVQMGHDLAKAIAAGSKERGFWRTGPDYPGLPCRARSAVTS
jgi:hypothetical protein